MTANSISRGELLVFATMARLYEQHCSYAAIQPYGVGRVPVHEIKDPGNWPDAGDYAAFLLLREIIAGWDLRST